MYTKAQYLNDMMKYDFKKYKVEVIQKGSDYKDLVIKVMLNGKVAYKTKPGAFSYRTVKDGKFVRTKWFIKYEQYTRKIAVWNDKAFKSFNSWSGNYRMQNEIKLKVDNILDEFARGLQ